MNYALKDYRFVNIQLCIPPAVPSDASLVLCTMAHKLLLCPIHFIGYLWQECSTTIALTDIDAVTMQLKLIQVLYATHRREHRDFDVNIIQFVSGYRHEPGVFKGSGTSHLCHYFVQWNVFTKVPDAATQATLLV